MFYYYAILLAILRISFSSDTGMIVVISILTEFVLETQKPNGHCALGDKSDVHD